ncbi:hypothetical protein EV192_1104 [Actinocrispum wychmicini]|uniref:Uncharacterized protein n=1 Tax=Actinocrispum wychmicini TaxID=1213861 RepID=A0A4R2JGS2_9PSEU|nr:hypothetical protein EV192_1104 [Actinocrispum wychmicini]
MTDITRTRRTVAAVLSSSSLPLLWQSLLLSRDSPP